MKKIKIKGQEYPCRVTMGAMVRFKRESGKDIRVSTHAPAWGATVAFNLSDF